LGLGLGVGAACGGAAPERRTWRDPEPGVFETGRYVLVDGDCSAKIALKADLPEPPSLQWRHVPAEEAAPEDMRTALFERQQDLWVATLKGAEEGARISYRVITELGSSAQHEFQFGRGQGESFRFAAFGISPENHAAHRSMSDALATEPIDFVIHTGHMVDQGGDAKNWDRFFQIERPLLRQTPITAVAGAHDPGARDHYLRYFMQGESSGGRGSFVFDWGNLRLVGLDAALALREGAGQFDFASEALAAGAEQGRLLVVLIHELPSPSAPSGGRQAVELLARRYGVELVLSGHRPDYQRSSVSGGTITLVTGLAGAAASAAQYLLVDVDGDSMIVRAVGPGGVTFDTHVVVPVAPSP